MVEMGNSRVGMWMFAREASSGLSPTQAARSRQVTIVGLLESGSGKSASCESLQGTEQAITTRATQFLALIILLAFLEFSLCGV
jgi:hypothetical protein